MLGNYSFPSGLSERNMGQGIAVGLMMLQNQHTGSQMCNEYINSCHYTESGGDAVCMAVVIYQLRRGDIDRNS